MTRLLFPPIGPSLRRSIKTPITLVPFKGGGGGSATAPAQFGGADWSVADRNTVDGATITITALPSNGDSAITDLQYQVDGGSWASLGGTTIGAYNISNLAFNTAQAIAIRAVNAVGNGPASATKSVTPTGSAETDALNARFTTPMTTARAKLYQALYASLKNGATSGANILAKLDGLYILAAADAQAARRNLVQDLYSATAVSSPTFTADRGYTGNGSSSYLETNYNTSSSGGVYAQNSAHAGVWSLTAGALGGAGFGHAVASGFGCAVYPRFTDNKAYGFLNGTATLAGASATVATGLGYTCVVRPDASNILLYRDNSQIGTIARASAAMLNSTLNVVREGNGYYAGQIAAAHFGAALSLAEEQDLYAAIQTYLQAVGAA